MVGSSVNVAEEPLPDEVLADLPEKLHEVLESTMENYDFNYQIEESQNIITHKLDELSGKFVLLINHVHKFVISHSYWSTYLCIKTLFHGKNKSIRLFV
jgi:hypothetical protein